MAIVYFYTATCPSLPAPDNGAIQCISGAPTPSPGPTPSPTGDGRDFRSADTADDIADSVAGDICIFTCNRGYQLDGSENRTCGSDGTWDGTAAICTVPPGMTFFQHKCVLHAHTNTTS